MQLYAPSICFSIAIKLLRFYRRLLLWNLLQLIAIYCILWFYCYRIYFCLSPLIAMDFSIGNKFIAYSNKLIAIEFSTC